MAKKKLKKLSFKKNLLIAFLALLITSFALINYKSLYTLGWNTYQDQFISLNYPKNWKIDSYYGDVRIYDPTSLIKSKESKEFSKYLIIPRTGVCNCDAGGELNVYELYNPKKNIHRNTDSHGAYQMVTYNAVRGEPWKYYIFASYWLELTQYSHLNTYTGITTSLNPTKDETAKKIVSSIKFINISENKKLSKIILDYATGKMGYEYSKFKNQPVINLNSKYSNYYDFIMLLDDVSYYTLIKKNWLGNWSITNTSKNYYSFCSQIKPEIPIKAYNSFCKNKK